MRAAALLGAALFGAAAAHAQADVDPQLRRGWEALRAMDCARCHGRHFDGWAAPSLLASVRDATRERFDRIVLDGDIARGMPGYRSQPVVVQSWTRSGRICARGPTAACRPAASIIVTPARASSSIRFESPEQLVADFLRDARRVHREDRRS